MKWRLVAALLGLSVVVLLAHDLPLINYLRAVEKERVTTVLERDSFIIAGRAEPVTQDGSEESIKYIEKARLFLNLLRNNPYLKPFFNRGYTILQQQEEKFNNIKI